MKLWQRFETQLEQARQVIPGGPQGWRPERIIFRDWWHWKDQEFGFAHGRLALTGQNAGGKSSVLALTIPMLLDGRTDPTRLDPAQSRDRFLHFYLLGPQNAEADNPESFRYEARTGYVALEFYHVTEKRYLTVGMGVSARREPLRITDWWGFLLLANQRLGRDFDVRGVDDACLGRRDFTRTVGDGGTVVTERGEYQRLVNQHLFGMEDDDYRALIEMLLQARRPKLGEQSGPDKVCDMLSQALPGIPADRLDRVGDVINNIEEYRRNLRDVQQKAEAVQRLDQTLLALAEALVQEAAQHYQEAQSKHGSLAARLRTARTSLAEADTELGALAQRAEMRQEDVARAEAARAQLKQGDAANLQDRLERARHDYRQGNARVESLRQRVAAGEGRLAESEGTIKRTDESFAQHRRALVLKLQELRRRADAAAWATGTPHIADAIRQTEVLAIADPEEVVLDAGPGAGLGDQARTVANDLRRAAEFSEALDRAKEKRAQTSAEIEALRNLARTASDQAEAAKDYASARAENLITALTDWGEASGALEPPAESLDQIAMAIREQQDPVARGHRVFTANLFLLGERRRTLWEGELDDLTARLNAARLQSARLEAALDAVQSDPGDPGRSELRATARAALGDQVLPLFRQIRFKEAVAPDLAARVEGALLEAGWLDLLTQPARGADAYLLPAPRTGPTLAAILEAEPDAPPVVGQLLSSIGWGEGQGSCWIAPDGTWQNGRARGTVAPWASDEVGYVGDEARRRRRNRRIDLIRQELDQAGALLAALEREQDKIKRQITQVDQELRGLDDLPWQDWFAALTQVEARERNRDEARSRLEAEKPRLQDAERAVYLAERQLDEAVEGVPGARGLAAPELRRRRDEFLDMAAGLDGLLPLYRELGNLVQTYKQQTRDLGGSKASLVDLRADLVTARHALAEAETTLQTLEEQIRDPELQRRLVQLQNLDERLRTLADEARTDDERKADLREKRGKAEADIASLEPEEREWSEKRTQRLDALKAQLQLHIALTGHAEGLEKAGPVSYLPKLLKLVETDDLAAEIVARRNALIRQEHDERHQLSEYRPTPQGTNTLIFYDDRIPLPAHKLRERLDLRAQEYASLLDEEQRQLFEDIIYEGILDELRRLIRQGREFTRRTTHKLRRPLSNGEVLSLRWTPVSPNQVPAARIGQQLETMQQGARFLSEEKRDILLATIKEEVGRVRSLAQDQGRELSYHEAVAEALDYRKWFEFQILSQMPGTSAPVPIRTKGFGQRSTSAKAWALAVPILAAVAARYDSSPRADVPRLVGLDEAFAGFDTKNQENYIALLSDLGFSWIITVPDELPYGPELSAVMTYRMTLEGNFHTGFPILWNGSDTYDPMSDWQASNAGGSS